MLVGVVLWLVFESGIHATIAGVVLGSSALASVASYAADLCVDADNPQGSAIAGRRTRDIRRANFEIREQLSVAERIADLLHPFSSYLIIPLFALVNAGIDLLETSRMQSRATSRSVWLA